MKGQTAISIYNFNNVGQHISQLEFSFFIFEWWIISVFVFQKGIEPFICYLLWKLSRNFTCSYEVIVFIAKRNYFVDCQVNSEFIFWQMLLYLKRAQDQAARVILIKIGNHFFYPQVKCLHLEFPEMEQLKKELARYRQKDACTYGVSDEVLHAKLSFNLVLLIF